MEISLGAWVRCSGLGWVCTFVKDITRWGIINNHDLRQVWLYSGKVFDIRAVSIRAMLTIIPALEIFPVLL